LVEYVNSSPVSRLWFLKNIDFVGTNNSVKPTPGLLNTRVLPIPTPLAVPWETDSIGLKYISVFLFAVNVVLIPALILITREFW